jgi:hypothetical protein
MRFQLGSGNWVLYRAKLGLSPDDEVDLHFGKRDPWTPYYEVMADVADLVRRKLNEAQRGGRAHVMFRHGYSTSRLGKTTTRSVVRRFMRSKEATPLIVRARCIQHEAVFVAKIRPLPAGHEERG